MSRQNMAMVERAMSLFSPFYRQEPGQSEAAEPNLQNPPDPPNPLQPELDALRAEVQRLRVELAASEARAVAADPVLGPGPEQSPAPYAAMEPAQAVKATQSRRRAKTEPSRH
ncbi:MAG: hypothetical protein JOY70_09045 [Acidisphaera sp.]|nr:hypothetical protein [Acidisphaera sp.]